MGTVNGNPQESSKNMIGINPGRPCPSTFERPSWGYQFGIPTRVLLSLVEGTVP